MRPVVWYGESEDDMKKHLNTPLKRFGVTCLAASIVLHGLAIVFGEMMGWEVAGTRYRSSMFGIYMYPVFADIGLCLLFIGIILYTGLVDRLIAWVKRL